MPALRDSLFQEAKTFIDKLNDQDKEMLKPAVLQAQENLKIWLLSHHGDSVRWSEEKALSELGETFCYPILRNKGVTSRFGENTGLGADWPYGIDLSAETLVAQIGRQLQSDSVVPSFSHLQSAARSGAEALAIVVDMDGHNASDQELTLLVRKSHTWGSALENLAKPAWPGQTR